MKNQIKLLFLGIISLIALSSCNEWVKPNHGGVMMENYGRDGKADFHNVKGKVSTLS